MPMYTMPPRNPCCGNERLKALVNCTRTAGTAPASAYRRTWAAMRYANTRTTFVRRVFAECFERELRSVGGARSTSLLVADGDEGRLPALGEEETGEELEFGVLTDDGGEHCARFPTELLCA